MSKRKPLVDQFLEKIQRDVFEKYQDIIKAYVYRRHGIYALYRRNRLYYVGLASNLRNRLRSHLKDRHGKAWDRFSVYLTANDEHMKELESLVLRIVPTTGNLVRGKFARAENLERRMVRAISEQFRQELRDIMGRRPRMAAGARRRGRMKKQRGSGKLPLADVFRKTISVRGWYKGKTYRARIRPNGKINYEGHFYDSPSHPARIIFGRGVNGWTFWHYEAKPKVWIPLQRVRK
ncbi:MAG: GIY-YIG nuclease family protein [Planctomycetota bacterium]